MCLGKNERLKFKISKMGDKMGLKNKNKNNKEDKF